MKGLLYRGIDTGGRSVIKTGRKPQALNISTERSIRRGYIFRDQIVGPLVTVLETATYEMACDFPRTESNFFGQGEYYAETETTGAWWTFTSMQTAMEFIQNEFH